MHSMEIQVPVVAHAVGGPVSRGQWIGGSSSRVTWTSDAQWVLGKGKTDASLAVATSGSRQRSAV